MPFQFQSQPILLDGQQVAQIPDLLLQAFDAALVISQDQLLDTVETVIDPVKALIDSVEPLLHHDRKVFTCYILLRHTFIVATHSDPSNRGCA
jgi:hypothetical protein